MNPSPTHLPNRGTVMDDIYNLLSDMFRDASKWLTNHLPHLIAPWLFDD